MNQLDKQQARIARLLGYLPPIHCLPPFLARVSYTALDRLLGIPKTSVKAIKDLYIPTHDSKQTIALRIYYPEASNTQKPKAMMYFHGGGCVIGSITSHDRLCRYLCNKSNIVIISVGYRLAPKHKFPAAIYDAIHAWNWVHDHLQHIDLTGYKLGAGGDSAGGYLACFLSLNRQQTELTIQVKHKPEFLYLLYPMMDLRGLTQSYRDANNGMLLTNTLMDYFSRHYLSNVEQKFLPLASPILFETFSHFPHTYILTCGADPLRDDGIAFAQKLESQNVLVTHDHFDDCMHSFISVYRASNRAQQATFAIAQRLKQLAFQSSDR